MCLFVWGITSLLNIFHSYGDATITGEELQFLTYIRHSWPLSSDVSLACHAYCDTDIRFFYGRLRGHVTLTPGAQR